jgi:hypothetical protein
VRGIFRPAHVRAKNDLTLFAPAGANSARLKKIIAGFTGNCNANMREKSGFIQKWRKRKTQIAAQKWLRFGKEKQ